MKKFEIGKTYYDQYACDSTLYSTITVVRRTDKTITFERDGQTRRAKIYTDSEGEYIMPDHYSMACVYRACRELNPAPEAPADAPAEYLDGYTVPEALIAACAAECVRGIMGAATMTTRQLQFMAALMGGAKQPE